MGKRRWAAGVLPALLVVAFIPARADAASAPDPALAGLLVVASVPGPSLDHSTDVLLRQKHLGGVVLFGRNVTGGPQLAALIRGLHRDKALITVDQEGGSVRRLRPQGPVLSARDMAKLPPARIETLMKSAGTDLRRTGIDVDLAPVADLDLPGGFIGSRAYGRDWTKVSADVAAAVRGLQSSAIPATVKHFPGLGGVRTSTDDAQVTASRISGPQLQPFRAAAQAGVAVTMVGHASYPGLGSGPASVQHQTYELLRGSKVGFQGVAMTDDLSAAAITVPVTVAAVNAIRAGADMVIVTGSPVQTRAVIDALVSAVRRGVIPVARFAQALERTRALRSACHLT